jgi:hypothetical protein
MALSVGVQLKVGETVWVNVMLGVRDGVWEGVVLPTSVGEAEQVKVGVNVPHAGTGDIETVAAKVGDQSGVAV